MIFIMLQRYGKSTKSTINDLRIIQPYLQIIKKKLYLCSREKNIIYKNNYAKKHNHLVLLQPDARCMW